MARTKKTKVLKTATRTVDEETGTPMSIVVYLPKMHGAIIINETTKAYSIVFVDNADGTPYTATGTMEAPTPTPPDDPTDPDNPDNPDPGTGGGGDNPGTGGDEPTDPDNPDNPDPGTGGGGDNQGTGGDEPTEPTDPENPDPGDPGTGGDSTNPE